MPQEKHTVLIIEDDLEIADMLNAYFRVQGYEVLTVNWGEDGINACLVSSPDLIILDIGLPDIDGYSVATRLRADWRTKDIPIIFLTRKRHRNNRLKGLELGADDYVTKPFDVQELQLRVRNSLNRSKQGNLNNPVTGLAEGVLVDEQLNRCLEEKEQPGLMLVSIENLDSFRDDYGFVASDDVLRAVSLMIQNSLRDLGDPDDFVGHFKADQFLLVTSDVHLESLSEHIRRRLHQSLDFFYPLKDREFEGLPENRLSIRIGHYVPQSGGHMELAELKEIIGQQLA